jgi:16S rRNA (guanine(966)-N(2))-methyltransferase RsmD
MSLRITGGRARGRVLKGAIPRGVRPTGARVREALFSMLGQDLSGVAFLDAFAGSGIVALEAWSRGARVTAVERNRRTAAELRRHVVALDADVDVVVADVLKRGAGLGLFDVVYVDPPFALDPEPILLALEAGVRGRALLEASEHTVVPDRIGRLVRERTRAFGSVCIHEFAPERP